LSCPHGQRHNHATGRCDPVIVDSCGSPGQVRIDGQCRCPPNTLACSSGCLVRNFDHCVDCDSCANKNCGREPCNACIERDGRYHCVGPNPL
jgi:hypothetical protein